jgi:FtsX-like permease family
MLACIGLYGIMAYDVIRRTHEIGVRMALGDERRTVVWLVLRNGLLLALFGIVLGIPAALAATRLVSNQLFGVNGTDPLTIISAGMILLAVAGLLATCRRAGQRELTRWLHCTMTDRKSFIRNDCEVRCKGRRPEKVVVVCMPRLIPPLPTILLGHLVRRSTTKSRYPLRQSQLPEDRA